MPTIPANMEAATEEVVTSPYFLVKMFFATPVLYSTIENVTWNGSWLAANMEVNLGRNVSVEVFNEGTTFGRVVLADGVAGRPIEIYQGYVNDVDHPAPVLVFSGEMSTSRIDDYVTISCKERAPKRSPRLYIGAPVFNHLPVAGTKFTTPTQIITLE